LAATNELSGTGYQVYEAFQGHYNAKVEAPGPGKSRGGPRTLSSSESPILPKKGRRFADTRPLTTPAVVAEFTDESGLRMTIVLPASTVVGLLLSPAAISLS